MKLTLQPQPVQPQALYREAPAGKAGTASGLLRTFGYVCSIASAAITGIVFRGGVDDVGLRHIALILIGIGTVVLLVTVSTSTWPTPIRSTGRGRRPGSRPRRELRKTEPPLPDSAKPGHPTAPARQAGPWP